MNRFILCSLMGIISFSIMAQQKIVQTAGRDALGDFAPEFAHLNDDILFGEVWSRNDLLSLRDRSLVTIFYLSSANQFRIIRNVKLGDVLAIEES